MNDNQKNLAILTVILVLCGSACFLLPWPNPEPSPATGTPSLLPPVGDGPGESPLASPTPKPTPKPTETPIPPTETSLPPTETSIPPTETSTPKPPASTPTSGPTATPEPVCFIQPGSIYTIKPGDNLWTISICAYGTPFFWPEIAAANGLSNPDLIHAGNPLIIPSSFELF